MIAESHFNDPTYWRAPAEEARTIAEDMKYPVSKRIMLEVADGYEVLAQRAEECRAW